MPRHKLVFQLLELTWCDFFIHAGQFRLIKKRWHPKSLLQPTVKLSATLRISIGFKRHRAALPAGKLLWVLLQCHNIRSRELGRQFHFHNVRLQPLIFLNERGHILLPQLKQIIVLVERYGIACRLLRYRLPYQIRPREQVDGFGEFRKHPRGRLLHFTLLINGIRDGSLSRIVPCHDTVRRRIPLHQQKIVAWFGVMLIIVQCRSGHEKPLSRPGNGHIK